jgi:DNA-binding response OmpR family regulator
VLEEVKANHPDLSLIIITGHGTVTDADEAMQEGAYDFVTKPFRVDHLIQIVKSALERREMGYVNVSGKLLHIPLEAGHPFRSIPATHSGSRRTQASCLKYDATVSS